jgi:hypothetical protein
VEEHKPKNLGKSFEYLDFEKYNATKGKDPKDTPHKKYMDTKKNFNKFTKLDQGQVHHGGWTNEGLEAYARHQLLAIQGHNTGNCKTLEKKALKYICNLFEITCTTWEEYLKNQKKKRPKVAPAEHQTTVNPTANLPTFSNEEAGANPNAGGANTNTVGISCAPPVSSHTVRFNFLEIANKKRAGTATTVELAALQAALGQ